jgi:hypothetical protein
VVQFKEAELNKFVGVAVDGKVKLYGAALGSRKHDVDQASDRSE